MLLRGTRAPYRTIQNPRGRRSIEIRGLASDERDTPAAQILIEGGGVVEHELHVRDATDIPRTDVLIEGPGRVEHAAHVPDAADVPRTDVPVEHGGIGGCPGTGGLAYLEKGPDPAANFFVGY